MFEKPIICTQPRKIAAMSLKERLEFELNPNNEQTPSIVDCQTGRTFEIVEGKKIIYATEASFSNFLMEKIKSKTKMSDLFGAIIVDEAHERTIFTDILLGILKQQLEADKNLKLVVTSATMDIQKMKNFFPKDTPLVQILGRLFQVDVEYKGATNESIVYKCIAIALEIHKSKKIDKQSSKKRKIGDILVFLPGYYFFFQIHLIKL